MQINISLAAANARLHNMKEERSQFDEASNQIISHFKTKVLHFHSWFQYDVIVYAVTYIWIFI